MSLESLFIVIKNFRVNLFIIYSSFTKKKERKKERKKKETKHRANTTQSC